MKNKINDKEILRLFWQVSVPYRRRRNLAIFFAITTIVISIFVGPLVIAELLNIIQHNQLQTANNLWTLIVLYGVSELCSTVIGWRCIVPRLDVRDCTTTRFTLALL